MLSGSNASDGSVSFWLTIYHVSVMAYVFKANIICSTDYVFYLGRCSVRCGQLLHALVLKTTGVGVKVLLGDWKGN